MQKQAMTSGAPWKHIIRFALPVLLGSLLQQLYNTVDAIIVGQFSSEEALSAVGTTGTFTFFFLAVALGLSAGNGVVIAQHYGAGDEEGVRHNASTGILFLLSLGVLAAVAGALLARPAFKHVLSVSDSILDQTVQYFSIYALGLVFQYGYNIFASILRAVGDSKATLYFLLISSVVNVLLDYLFVAIFHWGVVGAATATVIAQIGSLTAAFLYMRSRYPIFRFGLHEYVWDWHAIMKTIRIGMPISLQLVIVSVGLTFIQRAVNEFGKVMTASFTVGNRIEQYINLPCNAIQTTLATYTGQNVGAGKEERVTKGAHQGLLLSVTATIVISVVIWFSADKVAGWFGLSDAAMKYCLPHIKTVVFINIILSMYIPLFGVFQGTGHSGFPAIVASCALGVRVFVTYLFRYSSFFGYTIIWWNGLFGFGIGFLVTWSFFLSGAWRRRGA